MFTSVPKVVLELGLDSQDYEEIAKNIAKIRQISKDERQKILDIANKELSPETIEKGIALVESLAYDREVYRVAGLKYSEGPPKNEGLFTTAVADYLLKKR